MWKVRLQTIWNAPFDFPVFSVYREWLSHRPSQGLASLLCNSLVSSAGSSIHTGSNVLLLAPQELRLNHAAGCWEKRANLISCDFSATSTAGKWGLPAHTLGLTCGHSLQCLFLEIQWLKHFVEAEEMCCYAGLQAHGWYLIKVR